METFYTRIVNKHDTEVNWNKATNFTPLAGEIIIYDKDTSNTVPRIKVGDGLTKLSSLPFITDTSLKITGGNLSGHLYLTGAKENSSTSNTSQIVFGTASNNHVAISSNSNAIVINPTTSSTTNQIVLYLDKASIFPNGISGNASTATALTSNAGSATQPIYFSGGKPVATTYTLGKSVPSDAKFTDTTYTLSSFGITATATELNYTDGVTSNIQTQINNLKTSFQDGCDTIVAGCTTYGSTPASNSPDDIVTSIGNIYTNRYNAGVIATKVGTATAANVLSGKTFTNSSGVGISGTMVDKSGVAQQTGGTSLDTTNKRVQMAIPSSGVGYYSSTSKVWGSYSGVANAIGLTAAKIVKGNTILGIAGTAASVPTNQCWSMPPVTSYTDTLQYGSVTTNATYTASYNNRINEIFQITKTDTGGFSLGGGEYVRWYWGGNKHKVHSFMTRTTYSYLGRIRVYGEKEDGTLVQLSTDTINSSTAGSGYGYNNASLLDYQHSVDKTTEFVAIQMWNNTLSGNQYNMRAYFQFWLI